MGAKKANINNPNLIRLSRIKGSQIEIAINGVSSTQSDTLTSSTLNTTELAIGCRNGSSPANFINGDIGEIAFFDRNLSVKEKADSDEYFYKKWKMKKYEGALASSELNCVVSNCVSENYTGGSAVTDITCFNLKDIIGSTVSLNTTGIYDTNQTGYFPNGISRPQFSLRWKCNSDGTMSIDIEKGCIFFTNSHYTKNNNSTAMSYMSDDGVNYYGIGDAKNVYCCNGTQNSLVACPWPAW